MADIRITSGKAWLGFTGWGVQLKIYGQAPNSSPVLLTQTQAHNPTEGTLGNGEFAWYRSQQDHQYLYITTNGVGTYKIWAEHPDDSNLKAEDTYYFDPDNYQGSGDPFDWKGDGAVPDLVIVAKHFTVSGSMQSTVPVDELHLVVALGSSCDSNLPNFRIPLNQQTYTASFSQAFSLPTTGASTFYVYARDHNCGSQSNVETLTNVTGNGETINVPNTLIV